MLKLVVSNEVPRAQGPFANDLERFHAGETLEQKGTGERLLVIACVADGLTAMLMPLPEGEIYEAYIEDMKGWRPIYLPGPRLVDVRRRASKQIVWSSYVPDFDAAVAVWHKMETLGPDDFEVQIYTQHPDELAILRDHGYFGTNRARSL